MLAIVLALSMGFIIVSAMFTHNEIVVIVESPNNQYEAIAYLRSAGATTGFSPQVTIVKTSNPFKFLYRYVFSGNAFIAYGINGPYGKEYLKDHITVEWVDNKTLVINHSNTENQIHKKRERYWDIEIIYK